MDLSAADLTTRVLRHERVLLACAVLLLVVLGWAFLLHGMRMGSMEPSFAALVVMWCLMMVAMMLPSAAPAILLYARVREGRGDAALAAPWVFLAGYLVVWLLFSVAAAVIQMLLTGSSMALPSHAARSAFLIAAGIYQLSPMKSACLSQCRSPAQFITRHWRSNWDGAIRLGVMHGGYCVGCCWMLMALLFAGGVMNLLWVIGLTVLVASEKLLPRGPALQKIYGVALICWGGAEALASG